MFWFWFALVVTSIIATLVSLLVIFGNAMSDAPSAGFQDGGTIAVVWAVPILIALGGILQHFIGG